MKLYSSSTNCLIQNDEPVTGSSSLQSTNILYEDSFLYSYENIDRNFLFSVKEHNRTRRHGVTLAKEQCRLDIRKFSFLQITVNEWNRLGASGVNYV